MNTYPSFPDWPQLSEQLSATALNPWLPELENRLTELLINKPHGDFKRWQATLEALPDVDHVTAHTRDGAWHLSQPHDHDSLDKKTLETTLRQLSPWRKGPFNFFDVQIDTEWRSDWKWDRVLPHLSPLKNRRILDVGCGSGYHLWRMSEHLPSMALGIDPNYLFMHQFQTTKKYQPDSPTYFLPIGIDDMPNIRCFDTVFSMGVLYHRRSPLDHIQQLKQLLVPKGELVLETLIIEGNEQACLIPTDRYAQMRNVFFLPSSAQLVIWLQRCGFKNVRVVDESVTSIEEQRATDWMSFQSLEDFLDPEDHSKTIEGYPAPRRAVVIATAP